MFQARYDGTCHGCGERFAAGTNIKYVAEPGSDDGVPVAECCFEAAESNGAGFDAFTRGRAPGIAVLPRGTTAKDRCGKCFIVHSPGQDGCE